MKKPTTLPPPIPKPRPPPKTDVSLRSTVLISPTTGKPVVPPKPRLTPPPAPPTKKTPLTFNKIKADLTLVGGKKEISKQSFEPTFLSKEIIFSNEIKEEKPVQDIFDQDVNEVYDDVIADSTISVNTDVNFYKTRPPKKPLSQLPSKPVEQKLSSLTAKPIPAPRRASPRDSPGQLSPPVSPNQISDDDAVSPSPRRRAAALRLKEENNNAKLLVQKPKVPPKPGYLLTYYSSKGIHSDGSSPGKRDVAQQGEEENMGVKQLQDAQDPTHKNPSKRALLVFPNSNLLETSEECRNNISKSPGVIIDASSDLPETAVKKRIATRRHFKLLNASRTLLPVVDGKIRRPPPPPPPPPPEDEVDNTKSIASLKGPPLVSRHLTQSPLEPGVASSETISARSAEDQSLYSYAYEHNCVSANSSPARPKSNLVDESYVEPDPSVVMGFMDELKVTNEISSGQYEIPEEKVNQNDLNGQEEGDEASQTDSVGSTEYTFPEQIIPDDSNADDNADAEGSSSTSSDSDHEYDYPLNSNSPPPVPPHKTKHSGSYEFTQFTDDITDDEDEDDDIGEYVVPPDAQGSDDEDFDYETVWEDDEDEDPLYQVYNARTLRRDRTLSRKETNSIEQTDTVIDDLTKGTLRNMRMLWCEIPEVISCGILDIMAPEERKRQEAMFEVITSEASYLKSMNILESHFIKSPELTPGTPQSVIEKAQHHILFSNVRGVVEASQMFLDALRKRQTEALVISSISDIIEEFATKHFEVYVKYCSNQLYQDQVLKELRKSPRYVEGIERLERSSTAQFLSMHSFLVLPMQRITRLPLLVDAICHRCEPGSDEFVKTDAALQSINKVVQNCNEGARKMERMEEMAVLQPQVEFTIKPIALVSENRWLLRRGEIILVIEQSKTPLSKKKLKLKPVYMFLFNDLLLITKKKGESRYRVLDYAYRHLTKVEESSDPTIQLDYMLSLILLENSNGKTKDFILCAESETDKTRWLEAFNPPKAEQEGEKVYGAWDCPQVQVIHNYAPQQPDELALHEGDVLNVQRKLPDGWYYGERLCDGVCGWFPANYSENIRNEHVRARNLLQRYRLLAASKHLIGTVQTMKAPKTSKLPKSMMKRDTIS